jgi:hypothetical protein
MYAGHLSHDTTLCMLDMHKKLLYVCWTSVSRYYFMYAGHVSTYYFMYAGHLSQDTTLCMLDMYQNITETETVMHLSCKRVKATEVCVRKDRTHTRNTTLLNDFSITQTKNTHISIYIYIYRKVNKRLCDNTCVPYSVAYCRSRGS